VKKSISNNKLKVLVCDDDPAYLMIMRETLENEGLIVHTANNGETALAQYFSVIPDLLLLDVNMPLLSGFEVCKQIRQTPQGKDTPILMVTGADDYDSIENAFAAGATDFLPKPIKWPMVRHRVKYMLRSRFNLINLKESEERLRFLAYYDPLTGLPNRQHFKEQLESSLHIAKRDAYQLCIVFINLDRFKRINETLGRDYGDKLLKHVGETISETLRDSSLALCFNNKLTETEVARLGGDEFSILLSNVKGAEGASTLALSILNALSLPVKLGKYNVVVTPSLGISLYPNDGESAELLLKHADSAMHHAKDSGRGCFKFYSKSLNLITIDRLKLEESMRQALKNDDFKLHYQPQVCVSDNKFNQVEALIRWNHPENGIISPTEFIPIAEDSGLIVDIGQWVLTTACRQAKKWLSELGKPIKVAVNISARQFKNPTFIDDLLSVLADTGLPPKLLELELTESVIMNNVQENIAIMHELKKIGVSLSIDDFGTGYSSLSYLKRFPVDTLKIDQSFMIDITTDANDKSIVAAIIALATSLNLSIVVEGVETESQLAVITEIKFSNNILVQGYHFCRPMLAEKITELF